ncbi:MAG: flagellar biosynthesis protein FlgA [Rhodobiaceae bacterium]|nr:flagellar biosynthesis protein FlgA [Rhodobiaceae bacterium]
MGLFVGQPLKMCSILKTLAVLVTAFSVLMPPAAQATSRIKDIADIEGVRDNQLIGYGLVVGLNGTGDSLTNAPFTLQSLTSMLERLGVNTRDANLKTENVAAVMVTANLPPFSPQGTRIDVTVSAMGDSESLQGGTLLVTPLMGADGEVYAVSQGSVSVGGFSAGGDAATVTRGVPTNGRIANGAIVEREVNFEMSDLGMLRLALRNPDLTTARRIASAVNAFLGRQAAEAQNPTTVALSVPEDYRGTAVDLLTDIEQLRVEPDAPARVVIDESSGVIVMGRDVRVSQVAIAQGNLTISVTETPQVSQPNPFAQTGNTEVVPRTDIQIDEDGGKKLAVLDGSVSLQVLVDGLNALGVSPRDMITILQSIKAAGALQAEIEVL